MENNKYVINFNSYSPQIYSGLDKFNVSLAKKIIEKGYIPVFVFSDSISLVPKIYEDLYAIGARVEVLNTSTFLQTTTGIVKLFIRFKPKVVHANFVNSIKLITCVVSFLFRARYFVTFHSLLSPYTSKDYLREKGVFKRLALGLYLQFLSFFSESVITISNEINRQYTDFLLISTLKVKTIYIGTKLEKNKRSKCEIREALGLPNNKIILSNISAFEHIKGIDVICNAISVVKEELPNIEFLFCHIGGLRSNTKENNNYRASIYELTDYLGIKDKIVWMGTRSDIDDILSAFDIYVHPSRMEGLGVAIMEAASQSLPLIGSNIGGIPEIILNNKNGYLFDNEDYYQLAACIKSLILDEKKRREMGEAAYGTVSNKFSIKLQTEKIINLYFPIHKT